MLYACVHHLLLLFVAPSAVFIALFVFSFISAHTAIAIGELIYAGWLVLYDFS